MGFRLAREGVVLLAGWGSSSRQQDTWESGPQPSVTALKFRRGPALLVPGALAIGPLYDWELAPSITPTFTINATATTVALQYSNSSPLGAGAFTVTAAW